MIRMGTAIPGLDRPSFIHTTGHYGVDQVGHTRNFCEPRHKFANNLGTGQNPGVLLYTGVRWRS
jgi:hypothetical protein